MQGSKLESSPKQANKSFYLFIYFCSLQKFEIQNRQGPENSKAKGPKHWEKPKKFSEKNDWTKANKQEQHKQSKKESLK